ncbi:MAG TPA: hypothetical protein VN748_14120 [Pseudonocardiaceae bacterium]|jgi:hypothetical protein|nr:hypothetical protein [Pseudonocardiaceae bacterium]
MSETPTFGALLKAITHDVFMMTTWLFTAITLFVVALALYRLTPKRQANLITPQAPEETRT